jgi:hypothetical protein
LLSVTGSVCALAGNWLIPFAEETELSTLDLAMANRDPTTGVTDVILAHCSGCPVPQGKRQTGWSDLIL